MLAKHIISWIRHSQFDWLGSYLWGILSGASFFPLPFFPFHSCFSSSSFPFLSYFFFPSLPLHSFLCHSSFICASHIFSFSSSSSFFLFHSFIHVLPLLSLLSYSFFFLQSLLYSSIPSSSYLIYLLHCSDLLAPITTSRCLASLIESVMCAVSASLDSLFSGSKVFVYALCSFLFSRECRKALRSKFMSSGKTKQKSVIHGHLY